MSQRFQRIGNFKKKFLLVFKTTGSNSHHVGLKGPQGPYLYRRKESYWYPKILVKIVILQFWTVIEVPSRLVYFNGKYDMLEKTTTRIIGLKVYLHICWVTTQGPLSRNSQNKGQMEFMVYIVIWFSGGVN